MHLTKWTGNKVDVDLQLSTNMYCNIINKIMSNLDLFFSLYTQKNVGRVFFNLSISLRRLVQRNGAPTKKPS